MIEYQDFSLKIEPKRGESHPVIVLRSPAGEGRSEFHLPFDPDKIGELLFDLQQTVRGSGQAPFRDVSPAATRTPPQRIGDELFEALFNGPVRSLFDRSLGMIHGRQRGLRIKLHIDPEDPDLAQLASLPWEFLYRKETRDFLNLSTFTPILRYLDVQRPYEPLPLELPLRVLVVVSAPTGCPELDLDRERALIESSWAKQEGVQVEYVERATILALQDRLGARPYHVLHYMGHGDFHPRTGRGVLLMEDERGARHDVDGSTLGVLLRDVSTLRLVFLNACETATVTREKGLDPFAGVAAAIVMGGIPAVVAMQFPITDRAAITFSQRFYPLLARGYSVDAAVAEGRRAIRLAKPGTMEWGTPVLFMRAPQGVLFDFASGPLFEPQKEDRELAERLERLYTDGLSAYYLEDWERACRCFQEIVDLRPDYEDASAKLQESKQQRQLTLLYAQGQAAHQAEDWPGTIAALSALVAQAPDYRDAAALLEQAEKCKQLADLYAEAQQLRRAKQWEAVLRVFERIAKLDPDYPDPEGLLAVAEKGVEEGKRQAELKQLYSRALKEMERGRWQGARRHLARVLEIESGYLEAEQLLERVDARIAEEQARREQRERIDTLYQQALGLAHGKQWAEALAKMKEILDQDGQYPDPQGIAAQAQEHLAKERQEAERQKQLVTLYAEAVRLLRAGQYREALAKWKEVRDLDSRYPDRQKVEVTARKRLEVLARAAGRRRRLPKRAFAAIIGALGLIAVAVVVVGLSQSWIGSLSAPTSTPAPAARIPTATPIPCRECIAFVSDRDGNWEIYRMNADGGDVTRLTNNQATDTCPAWSPDGRRIAFHSDRDGNEEIYVMNADGSGVTRMTKNLASDWGPAWSPNGRLIAFTSKRDDDDDYSGEIYVMNADGSQVTRLTSNPADDALPAWSPDGRRIVFASDRDGNLEIYVMNADGSGVIRLTEAPSRDWSRAWSPDGKRIAFTRKQDVNRDGRIDDEDPPAVYVMSVGGSGVKNLTSNGVSAWGPSWSPDGSHIAFVSWRDGNSEIYVMNANGSEAQNLTNNPAQDMWPSWSPDGKHTVSGRWGVENGIYVVNADGGGLPK